MTNDYEKNSITLPGAVAMGTGVMIGAGILRARRWKYAKQRDGGNPPLSLTSAAADDLGSGRITPAATPDLASRAPISRCVLAYRCLAYH